MVGGFFKPRNREGPVTFGDLFLHGLPRPPNDGIGRRFSSAPVTTVAPSAVAAPPAAAAPPAPEPAKEPEPTKAPEPEKAAEPAPATAPPPSEAEKLVEWTQADDDTLLKMKAENKSWAAIEGVVKGRGKNALKERYKELMAKKGAESPKEGGEASSPESHIDGSKAKGKGKEGHKGKEMQENKDGPPNNGRPLIHFDEHDGLSLDDIHILYTLVEQYEERKWIAIASKLFDKTGKRIDPEALKGKLGV